MITCTVSREKNNHTISFYSSSCKTGEPLVLSNAAETAASLPKLWASGIGIDVVTWKTRKKNKGRHKMSWFFWIGTEQHSYLEAFHNFPSFQLIEEVQIHIIRNAPPIQCFFAAPCEVDRSTYYAYASIMQGLSSHGAPTGRAQKTTRNVSNWWPELIEWLTHVN